MKKLKGKIDLISVLPILIGVGVIILSGLYATKSKIPFTNMIYVDAVVDEIVDNEVYIKYEAGALVRKKKLNISASEVKEEQIIRVYYNKNDPNRIHVDRSVDNAKKIFKLGKFIVALGIIFLIIRIFTKSRNKDLKKYGRRIAATIKEIKVNKDIVRNGKNPHIVVCTWTNPEDNQTYTFNSPKIWGSPAELINIKNITTLIVYVDKKNFSKYIVDIDQLK